VWSGVPNQTAPAAVYSQAVFDRPLTPETALEGLIDIDPVADAIPASFTVKGMFCKRFVELLGPEFRSSELKLVAPPRGANYVAFKDYSQRDYCRLAAAASRKRFPQVSQREAVRLMAREDLATFTDSMIGKVVLAIAGDAHSTLLRIPEIYGRVAPGMHVRADDLDARTTRLVFDQHVGMVEYTLGQLEGVVLAFGRRPSSTIHELSKGVLAFDVTHGLTIERRSIRPRRSWY
jgi:uncharacterized protein (TIGR02265 family)